MIAALLCPGPSLAARFGPVADFYPFRVGVNRAACAFECGLWAASDVPLIMEWHPRVLGKPPLLTRRDTATRIAGKGVPWPATAITEDFAPSVPVKSFGLYTATAALAWLGLKEGVRRIDVYGADWTDAPDFDGVTADAGVNRKESRWERERFIWGELAGWLDGRGVEVARHTWRT